MAKGPLLLVGGANYGTGAGPRYTHSDYRPASADAYCGFRQNRDIKIKIRAISSSPLGEKVYLFAALVGFCSKVRQYKTALKKLEMTKKLYNVFDEFVVPEKMTYYAYEAMRGKRVNMQVRNFLNNIHDDLTKLYFDLVNQSLPECEYREMTIYEPKKRIIKIAPFYPHRIVHQIIVRALKDFWESKFIETSYACIPGRGIHKCMHDVSTLLQGNREDSKYALVFDIAKYYDSIDHNVLKDVVRKGIGDKKMLYLIDHNIDSVKGDKGLAIGNWPSQYYANLLLTELDHYAKRELKAKHYYRYMDDVVIISSSKDELHHILKKSDEFINTLKLQIKKNYQIFPISSRQIDFVGYRMDNYQVMLRKRILKRFYTKVGSYDHQVDIKHELPSYYGWISHLSNNHIKNIYNYAKAV